MTNKTKSIAYGVLASLVGGAVGQFVGGQFANIVSIIVLMLFYWFIVRKQKDISTGYFVFGYFLMFIIFLIFATILIGGLFFFLGG